MALLHRYLLILSLATIFIVDATTQSMHAFNITVNNRLQPFKCDYKTPKWCIEQTVDWYGSLLDRATGSVGSESRIIMIFSPPSPITFSANLTPDEASMLKELPEVTDLYDTDVLPPSPSVAPSTN